MVEQEQQQVLRSAVESAEMTGVTKHGGAVVRLSGMGDQLWHVFSLSIHQQQLHMVGDAP